MTATVHVTETQRASGDHVLVTAEWLAAQLGDPDVRVIEVDVNRRAYEEWHIEGAVLWDIYTELKDGDYRPVDGPTVEALVARSGIGPATTVVCYGYAPAFGVWLLRLHGHDDVRLLDVDRATWRAEGWPTTAELAAPAPLDCRGAVERPGLRARRDDVIRAVSDGGTTLVDVRTSAEFLGECFWPSGGSEPDGRAGHVPGARHVPIDGLYDGRGAFRKREELARVFALLDLDGDRPLVTYCTIGGRATTAWFVLTYLLGRDRVAVYDGSWAEWGRDSKNPVETEVAQG